jgi:hypothetical protein
MVPSSAPQPEVSVALNVHIPKSLDDRLEQFCFDRRDQKLTKRAFVEAAIRERLDREEGRADGVALDNPTKG